MRSHASLGCKHLISSMRKTSVCSTRHGMSQVACCADGLDLLVCRQLCRPYGRVDRPRLKRKLLNKCIAQGKEPLWCMLTLAMP